MPCGTVANPVSAVVLVLAVILGLILLAFLGLCMLSLFLPVVLVVAGFFIMFRGPMPMNARLAVGLALVFLGAAWLLMGW